MFAKGTLEGIVEKCNFGLAPRLFGAALIYLGCMFGMNGEVKAKRQEQKEKIVFVSSREPHLDDCEIYSMNTDGTDQKRLTEHKGLDIDPAISPDGTQVAYESFNNNKYEIWVMNIDGSNKEYVTDGQFPAWSPNGNRLIFSKPAGGLSIIDREGKETVLTTVTIDLQPVFSQDGTYVLFSRNNINLKGDIYKVKSDGTEEPVNITKTPGIDEYDPAWSPDGSRIAFRRKEKEKFSDVYVMNSDGTGLVNLSEDNQYDDMHPKWSPDGKFVIYTSTVKTEEPGFKDSFYNNEVIKTDINGKSKVRLTDRFSDDWGAVWAPATKGEGKKGFFNRKSFDIEISP